MSGDNSHSNVWLYNPSMAVAIIAVVLYGILAACLIYQTARHRAWYLACVFVGALFEVAGYIARVVSAKQQREVGPYAASLTLIIVAPIFVAAGDYLLISKLIVAILPLTQHHIFRVSGRKLTLIFVICDVLTFLVQASGSGVASSGNWEGDTLKIGQFILVAGLALQLLTFGFFLVIMSRFSTKITALGECKISRGVFPVELRAVYVSSAMIIIRCMYRLIEFATGIHAYLFTHEWPYYVLEGLPMLIALGAFCFYFPPRYLTKHFRKEVAMQVQP